MHVLTILQRVGDVEPLTLNVLSAVWGRLKGMGGTTFSRLTTNLLFADPLTMVEYDEMSKKKSTAFAVKVKDLLAFAPD